MIRKTLTPLAFGFAAVLTLGACGGGDDVDMMDTGFGDPMAAPAPAPAPAPMTDSIPMDTMMRDTLRTDTGTVLPPA